MASSVDGIAVRVGAALDAELDSLRAQPASRTVFQRHVLPDVQPAPRLAVVAADAGNLELRLHPLRIGLVRVATSAGSGVRAEAFVPLSRPPSQQLAWVLAEAGMEPLRAAAVRCGLDPSDPAAWLPARLPPQYALHFLREVLEWLLLVHTAGTAGRGTLLLRDGLLRSVALPRATFTPICRALAELTTSRGILLVAIAKRAPGGADFLSYLQLALGADLAAGGPGVAVELPPEVEERFAPAAYASLRGRRAGLLFLLPLAGSQARQPLAVEIPVWQRGGALATLANLSAHGRGGYPFPGYPAELLAAHQSARIAPIEREILVRAFLRRLAQERPALREALLAAHLVGQGITLDPNAAADAAGQT